MRFNRNQNIPQRVYQFQWSYALNLKEFNIFFARDPQTQPNQNVVIGHVTVMAWRHKNAGLHLNAENNYSQSNRVHHNNR